MTTQGRWLFLLPKISGYSISEGTICRVIILTSFIVPRVKLSCFTTNMIKHCMYVHQTLLLPEEIDYAT